MDDLKQQVERVLYTEFVACLRDYDVADEVPKNDPEFGQAVCEIADHLIDLVQNYTKEGLTDE